MCRSCVSISLLPEFGWSIKDQYVFGPGSVFQGFVTLNNSTQHNILLGADKIKLLFTATETILPYTISPGVIRSSQKTIFSVQKTLWESKNLIHTPVKCTHTFSFTIQLPLIQYPPTVEQTNYKCEFKLIAMIDMTNGDVLRKEKPVIYMPLIETSLLKTPLIINTTSKDQEMTTSVKLAAQDFVPGDRLNINLLKLESTTNKRQVTVRTELIQTLKISLFEEVPDQVKVVASGSEKVMLPQETVDVGFQLPADLTPSFDSHLVTVSYTLHIYVQQKGVLAWRQCTEIGTVPITVGTLGYGIRYSDQLVSYCSTTTALPKFMQDIEYEESLPVYEPTNLPSYEEPFTPPQV